MIKEYIQIEVGMLLMVEVEFWSSGDTEQGNTNIKRLYKKGEILEIRYPYAWHFRDVNNNYDHATAKTLIANCSFYGLIHADVISTNNTKLDSIISSGLFHKPSDFKIILNKGLHNTFAALRSDGKEQLRGDI